MDKSYFEPTPGDIQRAEQYKRDLRFAVLATLGVLSIFVFVATGKMDLYNSIGEFLLCILVSPIVSAVILFLSYFVFAPIHHCITKYLYSVIDVERGKGSHYVYQCEREIEKLNERISELEVELNTFNYKNRPEAATSGRNKVGAVICHLEQRKKKN